MRYLIRAVAGLIFIPLLLALLFAMPLEFCVSSWHLWRAGAATEGRVISFKEETVERKRQSYTRNLVRYGYTVDGRSYEGDRVRAGWISSQSYAGGGEDNLKPLSPGSQITVWHDPAHPEFALLEYGWPKWSVGVSLAVWGMVVGWFVFDPEDISRRSRVLYGLTRGTCLLGGAILALHPPTLAPRLALPLLGTGLVLSGVAGVYGLMRYSGVK